MGHLCKHCHKVWSEVCGTVTPELPQELEVVDTYGYNPEANKESKAGTNKLACVKF